jgi:signal transduction histidine kinase
MNVSKGATERDSDLRRRAEAQWVQNGGNSAQPLTEVQTQSLLHELQVHQIELEMQNDELRRAKVESEALAANLHQAEKLTAIGQLAGGIAHNFNNQLGGILGSTELLRARLEDPALQRYADDILKGTHRAAKLTEQLLSFARKGRHGSTPVDLHALLPETISILQNSIDKQIRIEQYLNAERAIVTGDPTQLQSALLNLGLNARDAMPTGGVLSFATATVDLSTTEAQARGLAAGRYIEITVSDTGIGLSPEALSSLFDPFFTTKEMGKGTGLGLAATHGAVLEHGGTITGRNRENGGAEFTIMLPVTNATVRPAHPSAAVPVKERVRVLLVDDESVILNVCTEMLCDLNCEVTAYPDGPEAIACYRERWREIDLVILDVVMPQMGGA